MDRSGTATRTAIENLPVEAGFSTTSRQVRWAGLSILLCVAVLPFLLWSTWSFFVMPHHYSAASLRFSYFNVLLTEGTSLGLLFYVLGRNGQSLSDIGLDFRAFDFIHAILLSIGGWFVVQLCYPVVLRVYEIILHHKPPQTSAPPAIIGTAGTMLLFTLVNPFFEEMIVRGFVISELCFLTGKGVLATAASVLLQTSYHLYQGIPNAITDGFVFLLFSVFYLKTRRLWPVIIAHLLWDLSYVLTVYSYPVPPS